MVKVILFSIASAALAYASRASVGHPRCHGFYRFFAWQSILGLFFLSFLNFQQWFGDPFSIRQVVSWTLLVGCMVPAGFGVYSLRKRGKPDARRTEDATLIWIEKTTRLVTSGVFRYIRHPLYTSLLMLAWGVFLKRPSWLSGCVAMAATGFLLATAKAEEGENAQYFGTEYLDYMRRTRMFIPFVF